MKTLKHWSLDQQLEHHVELTVDGQHTLCLYVLEENLFRVLLKRQGQLALDRTWSIAPQQDVPWEGRARDDLSGFSLPAWQMTKEDDALTIATRQLRVTVHQPLWLEWSYRDDAGEWQTLASDRPTSAYLANAHGDGVAHYLSRRKDERFYGLGEKAGDLQRNGKRYVFNWNYDKVPQPKVMSQSFHDAGLKLAANIKPCLLQDHPRYGEVAERGLFIRDSQTDAPERSSFWDDEGSHLDFTNPHTVAWWQEGVTTQLLEMGIDSTWNDNNEYEVWDGEARCYGFGREIAIKHIRPVMPLLMMRASMEAQQRFAPQKRPYLISRSGCAGMQRYVQTWSGDNRTNWDTLRYNIRMGLGMSLSGLFNVGHDVGGFSGDKPEPELFVRWVQNGVMHPRFTIHSWNDDQTVNEAWMYPEITPAIRSAIELRYRLLPYLYTLLWQAHADDEPMLRPTFLDHQHDTQTFAECDDFLLGRDLLVASVVEPGARQRQLWLPDNQDGWYDFYSHQWFAGGQWVTLDAPLEKLPLLVRAGAGLPLSERISHVDAQKDDRRELQLFPLKGTGSTRGLLFEDDGESWGYKEGDALWLEWEMICSANSINLNINARGSYRPAWKALKLSLPAGEKRKLLVNGVEGTEWRR
ncbi:TPA: DUF5110 domain-containing protein [Klebsiella variicola subsp. variicola]|nr:DUF5110 domain-containing protein [Klebsiella variicola subsp. variicola]